MNTPRHPGEGRRAAESHQRSLAARGWAEAHARCLVESLGRLYRRWLASLLTVAVIGIALALPTGLFVLMDNLDGLTSSWQRAIQASLYLEDSLSEADGQALADRLAARDTIESGRYISAAAGLASFREASGFGAALDALQENPLPAVITITPRAELERGQVVELIDALGGLDGVARAELDQVWLERLYAIVSTIERTAWVIALLLAAAVLFIVGNTIRLDIENRREEIEVMKLLGASDAFIRRPFLYSGVWYGLFGALFALAVIGLCFAALAGPFGALVRSYDGMLAVQGLGLADVFALLGCGIVLGWGGCALSVNRRLAAIEPR